MVECIFARLAAKLNQPNDCAGKLTKHHLMYKVEGGNHDLNWRYQGVEQKGSNLVPMCEGHQKYIHSKDTWGDEDFSYLKKDHKRQNEKLTYNRSRFKREIEDYNG